MDYRKKLEKERRKLDQDVERLIDRIVDAENSTVVKALEKRIEKLQQDKIALDEKATECVRSVKPYEQMYRTALQYISSPHQIWAQG